MEKFIRSLELQTLKVTEQERANVAIDKIEMAFEQLASSPHQEDLSIRNIATKSGYSVGSIYRYFKKIDYLFINLFLKRAAVFKQKAIELIKSHQPNQEIEVFLRRYIDFVFSSFFEQGSPRIKRQVIRYILRNANHPERFTTMMLEDMLIYFKTLIDDDLTGTFKKMSETELFFCLKALQGVSATIIIEGGALSGSKVHKHYSLIIAMRIFSKEPYPAQEQNVSL